MEGFNVSKLEEDSGETQYKEGEAVREDGSHGYHDHIKTDL